jgi:hypothetical protein
MATSLIYRSAAAYETAMLLLYGRHYHSRCRAISSLIPENATVVELCCGPGHLYRRYLRSRVRDYYALDINANFVKQLIRMGARGRVCNVQDLRQLPPADYVILQASLYHFLPDPRRVVDLMIAAARRHAIIAEPIRNLASEGIPLISQLARRCSDPGSGRHRHRFDEPALDSFFAGYGDSLCQSFLIPGGREKVFVLRGLSGNSVGRAEA